MPILEACPRSIFSWSFELFADGQPVTIMNMVWFREGGTFSWEGAHYTLSRESSWSGDFLLESDGRTIARATKPSAFRRRFEIHASDRTMTFEAASPLTRRFRLLENDRTIGSVAPKHALTRRCSVELPDDLSIPVQVFLFWLAVLMWRRAANSD